MLVGIAFLLFDDRTVIFTFIRAPGFLRVRTEHRTIILLIRTNAGLLQYFAFITNDLRIHFINKCSILFYSINQSLRIDFLHKLAIYVVGFCTVSFRSPDNPRALFRIALHQQGTHRSASEAN